MLPSISIKLSLGEVGIWISVELAPDTGDGGRAAGGETRAIKKKFSCVHVSLLGIGQQWRLCDKIQPTQYPTKLDPNDLIFAILSFNAIHCFSESDFCCPVN